MNKYKILLLLIAASLSACQSTALETEPASNLPKVIAMESFLADIAQNVAGERLDVASLIPLGVDLHAFEPTPQDVAKIEESPVLILNGCGLEEWFNDLLPSLSSGKMIIEACEGITPRQSTNTHHDEHEIDPHFWLDPDLVIHYVENIRDGFMLFDPGGAEQYGNSASQYIQTLQELDAWISAQVEQIPIEQRLLVTNHENFGYFADRYGFQVVGAIIPSVTTGATPTAQELAQLIEVIHQLKVKAIFLELGANPQLAEQIANETDVKVISGLYSHSLSSEEGSAPTYLEMMRYNVLQIVDALK
jgi:ABC-type Zn uptake system ZnuABC Zn-binding protein ZnuA